MDFDGRPVFRCTFRLTDPKRAAVGPSNIFLAASSKEDALRAATLQYEECMALAGISGEPFASEVRASSFDEAAEYARQRAAGHKTSSLVS